MDQRLAVEIGDSYIVLVAGADKKPAGLEYFTKDEDNLDESLDVISHHSSLLKKNYSETRVFYNLEETVLVPVGQFNTSVASEFIDLAYGNKTASRVNVENINVAPGIVNVYRSDEHWQEVINRHFRAVTKRHLYSKLVEQAIAADQQIRLIFYNDSYIIVAVKNRQLRIIRSFALGSDADVLYHILNVCKQADIDVPGTTLNLCGTIDSDSSTCSLLRKYFVVRLQNADHDVFPGDQNQYPRHYFTSFINLLS